jgi:hypothetical protein
VWGASVANFGLIMAAIGSANDALSLKTLTWIQLGIALKQFAAAPDLTAEWKAAKMNDNIDNITNGNYVWLGLAVAALAFSHGWIGGDAAPKGRGSKSPAKRSASPRSKRS